MFRHNIVCISHSNSSLEELFRLGFNNIEKCIGIKHTFVYKDQGIRITHQYHREIIKMFDKLIVTMK